MSSGPPGDPLPTQGLDPLALPFEQINELIERTRWADGFSARELESLAKYFRAYAATKGAVVVQEGAREAHLCLIARGQVTIVKASSDGDAKRIGTSGIGRTFGEMSLIDGEPRSASVVADEPSLLLLLTKESFARMMDEAPRLAVKILIKIARLTSQRLRHTSGVLVDHLA
jgi:CRP/FNR family cyclic AMP-dependent transcriptional regulator